MLSTIFTSLAVADLPEVGLPRGQMRTPPLRHAGAGAGPAAGTWAPCSPHLPASGVRPWCPGAGAQVKAQGVQIVIADSMPHASYRPTYAAISYPYRLRHLAEAPYPPNTCFRTALFINGLRASGLHAEGLTCPGPPPCRVGCTYARGAAGVLPDTA